MDGTIDKEKLFCGKYHLDDKLEEGTSLTIAEANKYGICAFM